MSISPESNAQPAPAANLDDRGLPPDYKFDPNWELTPRQVKSMLDQHDDFVFIDCRLPSEHAITSIPGTTLLPLQQLPQRIGELRGDKARKIVVHCKSGGRSMQFVKLLKSQGFSDAKSMAGGIVLWNKDIRPGGPQY